MNDLAELHELEADVKDETDPIEKEVKLKRIEELKKTVPKIIINEVKPKVKTKYDLNDDGVFDKNDKKIAGKVLASGKRKKK